MREKDEVYSDFAVDVPLELIRVGLLVPEQSISQRAWALLQIMSSVERLLVPGIPNLIGIPVLFDQVGLWLLRIHFDNSPLTIVVEMLKPKT